MNNFKDYGFTADFEGEIFKLLKSDRVNNIPQVSDGEFYYGVVKNNIGQWLSKEWTKTGKCTNDNIHNLTPIKKEWYKDKDSLNKAFYDIVAKNIVIINWLDFKENVRILGDINTYRYDRFRPATKEELERLYYEG